MSLKVRSATKLDLLDRPFEVSSLLLLHLISTELNYTLPFQLGCIDTDQVHAKAKVDRYGRIVGRVYVDGLDVNRELVARGMAWVYRKYSNDPELLRLEAEAREKGLGLWADPNPVPPWEWRRGRRE